MQNSIFSYGKHANRLLSGGRPVGQTALAKKGFGGFVCFVTKKEWNGRLERQNPPIDRR